MIRLIITCELNELTEKESLSFIKKKLGVTISRRTFYEFKRGLYQLEILKKTGSFLPNLGSRKIRRLFPEKTYLNTNSDLAKRYGNSIHLDFIPENSYNFLTDAYKTIRNSRDFFGRLNKLKVTSRKNYESVPENATFRREYVNCGYHSCRGSKHGPYYYAYWRDQNSKLCKKYIGKYDPRNKDSVKLIDIHPLVSSHI